MMEKSLAELTAYQEARCASITENLKRIQDEVAEAAVKSGRTPEEVHLMAVTKTVDAYFVNHALAQGIDLIGENYVQEILAKKPELHLEGKQLQLIGHLQTNKVKQIITEVDAIQSVDSVKLAKEISKQAVKHGLTMKVLLEINIGQEESKSGIPYDAAKDLAAEISELPNVQIDGLMAIPPICQTEAEVRAYFAQMQKLYVDMKLQKMDNVNMSILSMGMSADYVPAILEGANLVRVGSAIFGARTYH
jgi:PLP dependent protein